MAFLFAKTLIDTNLTIIIVCSVAGALLVLGLIIFILEKTLFQKRRCNKVLKDLVAKYEYLHALLTGQDSQFIQRLEIISRTNLLYVDIHASYFKRSKELRETIDVAVSNIISDLGEYLEEKKYKEFKRYYKNNLNLIRQYDNNVNQLNNDLMQIIKPEEDCREASIHLKEKFRQVKSKYNMNEDNLTFVALTFDRVFDNIDRSFAEFDALVETANYDEANQILPKVEKVLDKLNELIDQIPALVDEFTVKLPGRVSDLLSKYNQLLNEKKPLRHLNVEEKVHNINGRIETGKEQIQRLTVKNLDAEAKDINATIDGVFDLFEKEDRASKDFDSKKDEVLDKFSDYEKEYIKIKNNIERYRKVYVIDEEHENMLKDISKTVDNVSKDKRKLDVYIHAPESSPFTILVEKVNAVEVGSVDLGKKIDAFKEYQASLKNDCDSAFKNLKVKYEQLKSSESTIRNWKINAYVEKYKPVIDECYKLLDECAEVINTIPINVNTVNAYSSKINEKINNLVKGVQELDTYKNKAAEQIIVANRDRMKFAEINSLVKTCESLYFEGNFKSAYEGSSEILKKLNSRDGK